jgi:EpsI family protein
MTSSSSSWKRFALATAMLAGTVGTIHSRNRVEVVPAHKTLGLFPSALPGWQGQDLSLSPDVRQSLGPGEFLFRDYFGPNQTEGVNLLVAYFPSQRMGDTIHSPKNCLPAEGWTPISSKRLWIENPGKSKFAVNRYVVQDDDERAVVLYWYQAHGRQTASEYGAKLYLVADSLRLSRSDGALIRIFVPIPDNEGVDAAEARAVKFTRGILPLLDDYVPR